MNIAEARAELKAFYRAWRPLMKRRRVQMDFDGEALLFMVDGFELLIEVGVENGEFTNFCGFLEYRYGDSDWFGEDTAQARSIEKVLRDLMHSYESARMSA